MWKKITRPLAFKRLNSTAPRGNISTSDFAKLSWKSGLIFFGSFALFGSYFYYEKERLKKQKEEEQSRGYGKPKVGGPFRLVDTEGNIVTNESFAGKYMLIYFGYTFCPDICPEELDRMALIINELKANGVGNKLAPIFISCDPKRDSLSTIKDYLKEFHPDLIGLIGTYQQTKKVAKAYRLYFSAPPAALDDDQDYLVDHSIFFYFMGPDGKYLEHFGRNDTEHEIAQKMLKYMQ